MGMSIDHIVVDLDGTLLRTDIFHESILQLIKRNPFKLIQLAIWILQGRSVAMEKIARLVDIDVEILPYEPTLIEYLREKKALGKRLILATASHRVWAEKVALHLKFFDHVIATEPGNDITGKKRLAAIRGLIGDEKFCYCGDSSADRPI